MLRKIREDLQSFLNEDVKTAAYPLHSYCHSLEKEFASEIAKREKDFSTRELELIKERKDKLRLEELTKRLKECKERCKSKDRACNESVSLLRTRTREAEILAEECEQHRIHLRDAERGYEKCENEKDAMLERLKVTHEAMLTRLNYYHHLRCSIEADSKSVYSVSFLGNDGSTMGWLRMSYADKKHIWNVLEVTPFSEKVGEVVDHFAITQDTIYLMCELRQIFSQISP